jgi:glutathione S-transferase
MKPNLPFGQVPIYNDEQIGTIAQTRAIGRYIARTHNLDGQTTREKAQVDMYCEFLRDIFDSIFQNVIGNEQCKNEDTRVALWTEKILPHLKKLDTLVQENGHLVGNSLTLADVLAFDCVANYAAPFCWAEVLKLGNVISLLKNVTANERVRNYIKSDKLAPITLPPMPFFHFLNKPEHCAYPEQIFA